MADMVEPIAVDARGVELFLPFKVRSWRRMDSSGCCPAGYRVSGRKVWRLSDLRRWAELGFPDRATFEQLRRDEAQGGCK